MGHGLTPPHRAPRVTRLRHCTPVLPSGPGARPRPPRQGCPSRRYGKPQLKRGIIVNMDPDRPELDQPWDKAARNETEAERLDRNWASLLQELRVVQTGVQLLTGLLLTLPFQERFSMLDEPMRIVYLVTVACSAAATALLVAPVGMHRILFRRHRLNLLVSAAHRCAFIGLLLLLGLAMAGVVMLIFDTVARARGRRDRRRDCPDHLRRDVAGGAVGDASRTSDVDRVFSPARPAAQRVEVSPPRRGTAAGPRRRSAPVRCR